MHKHTRYVVLCSALVLVASAIAAAQQIVSPGVHPISGRRYALTMSYLGADWLDRSERVQEEEPEAQNPVPWQEMEPADANEVQVTPAVMRNAPADSPGPAPHRFFRP